MLSKSEEAEIRQAFPKRSLMLKSVQGNNLYLVLKNKEIIDLFREEKINDLLLSDIIKKRNFKEPIFITNNFFFDDDVFNLNRKFNNIVKKRIEHESKNNLEAKTNSLEIEIAQEIWKKALTSEVKPLSKIALAIYAENIFDIQDFFDIKTFKFTNDNNTSDGIAFTSTAGFIGSLMEVGLFISRSNNDNSSAVVMGDICLELNQSYEKASRAVVERDPKTGNLVRRYLEAIEVSLFDAVVLDNSFKSYANKLFETESLVNESIANSR